jgi:large subunit ribosomal protein L1
MAIEQDLEKALKELREGKKRKFDQTLDLVINLQKFNVKKDAINSLISVPHKIKDKKIAAFLESESKFVDTISASSFAKYKDKKTIKSIVDKYDFFMAQSSLMPKVATTFGRALGPTGKMPSPQLGILLNADEKSINEIKEKVNKGVKIRTKEASIKVAVGKESMSDKDLIENALTIINSIKKSLIRGNDNIKNIELKFTMTKPVKIHVR